MGCTSGDLIGRPYKFRVLAGDLIGRPYKFRVLAGDSRVARESLHLANGFDLCDNTARLGVK